MSSETITQEHRTAGVTAAAPWRVRAVNVLPDYRLSITCNDGKNGIVDMSALVNSPDAGIYAALKDAQLFQKVSIELGALSWPNGADLDPLWTHEEISKNKTWSVPEVSPHFTLLPHKHRQLVLLAAGLPSKAEVAADSVALRRECVAPKSAWKFPGDQHVVWT